MKLQACSATTISSIPSRNKRTEKTTIFNLFHTGCLACLSKWPKWNYFFCIDFPFFPFICIISYSPAMAGAWDRISMFWGERKIVEKTYLHLKLLSPNGARAFFFSKPLPIGLEMGWDPRIFGLPQIGAEMGRKCRILHRNKKYKKNGKIQLVSQWVFSMSFKITKVKLLFLGWFYVLFVHLLKTGRAIS